jgi:multidrug resistance protein, MATE family
MGEVAINTNLKVEITNKQILGIALPITLSILIPQLNLLINSIFLGHVGGNALGDAGITGVFYLIFAVVGHGLNNALQSVFSNNAGSGDTQNFKIILAQGIRISIICAAIGIAFTWFIAPFILQPIADPKAYPAEITFLKIRIFGLPFLYLFMMGNAFLIASLNAKYLIIGFVVEAASNILFDYLLIFGKAGFSPLGFNGAAVASVIAEFLGMITVFTVIIFSGLKKQYSLLAHFKFDQFFSQQVFKVALPLIAQFVISVTTWLVFFFLIEGLHNSNAKAISNVMRNVFGLAGVFIWAFAATSNNMVSNLIGQGRKEEVLFAIKKITFWSISFCAFPVLLLNIFPTQFFNLFAQGSNFTAEGIPVIRIVSLGMILMSVANIWLNAVTGTGKTKMNLLIELVAISFYLIYTFYFTKVNYISLAMAWSNEFVYWTSIFAMAFIYLNSGKWKK